MTDTQLSIVMRRFARVFLSTFIMTASGFLEAFGKWQEIETAFGLSFRDGITVLGTSLVMPLMIASFAGGLNAIGKYLRENKTEYTSKILEFISKIF